jgi:hypothetical protein
MWLALSHGVHSEGRIMPDSRICCRRNTAAAAATVTHTQAGLFVVSPQTGAFDINPASGLANEMHLEYFRFTGRCGFRCVYVVGLLSISLYFSAQ